MAAKKGNKYAVGNKGGRPSKFDISMIDKAQKYLESCIDEETERLKSEGKESRSWQLGVKVSLPSIAGLAIELNVSRATIYEWASENEVFSTWVEKILSEQEKRLLENGLAGTYNPMIARLVLVKHGYVERQEITGKDGEKLIDNEMSYERAKAIISGEGSHTSDSKK